jgi:hypothetical protein
MHWPPPRLAYTRKLPVNLKDGRVHAVRIAYQPPILTVTLDGQAVLTSTVDLSSVVDRDGAAYVGFTASTGNGFENHDILTWSLQRCVITISGFVEHRAEDAGLPDWNCAGRAQVEDRVRDVSWSCRQTCRGVRAYQSLGTADWSTMHKGRLLGSGRVGPQGCNGPEATGGVGAPSSEPATGA